MHQLSAGVEVGWRPVGRVRPLLGLLWLNMNPNPGPAPLSAAAFSLLVLNCCRLDRSGPLRLLKVPSSNDLSVIRDHPSH